MMSVMPIVPPVNSAMPPGASSSASSGGGFEETLRSESASLKRADDHAAARETSVSHEEMSHEEREAPVRAGGRGEQDGEPTDKPGRPEPVEAAAKAGESQSAASESAPQEGQPRPAVKADLSKPAKVEQAEALSDWLIIPQVVAVLVAVVGEQANDLVSRADAKSSKGAAEGQIRFAPATLDQISDLPGKNRGFTAPQFLTAQVVVAGKALPEATPPSENTLAPVATLPVSGVESLPLPPVGVAEPALGQTAMGEERALAGKATLATVADSAAMPQVSGSPRSPFSALQPEVTQPTAGSEQVIAPPATNAPPKSAAAPSPEVAASIAGGEPLVIVQTAETPGREVSARAVGSDPLVMTQAATPGGNITILSTERPALVSGENSQGLAPGQPGEPGWQAAAVVTAVSPDAESDARQFSPFARPAVGKVTETAQPSDSGPTEFASLMSRSDSSPLGGVARAAVAAEATAVAATLPPVPEARIVDQVVSRLSMSSASGETNLSMILHPKELGEVRVDLISGKDGLRAHLHSQTQMVQEVLERNLPRLREAFESQGLKISDLQVSCDARRDGGSHPAFQQREQGQMAQSRYRLADSVVEAEWPGGLGGSNSGWSAVPGFSLRV